MNGSNFKLSEIYRSCIQTLPLCLVVVYNIKICMNENKNFKEKRINVISYCEQLQWIKHNSQKTQETFLEHIQSLATNSSSLPGDQITLTGTPHTTGSHSTDIFHCITKMSSLNLTAENEITISYTQHTNPKILQNVNTLTTQNASVIPINPEYKGYPYKRGNSEQKVKFGHNLGSHAQQNNTSLESAAGSCTILVEAPSRKVLSILFLNQTCSRDNLVRVQDTHDGWSTTLNGCSPWVSPGYDVTTVNRSAVLLIKLSNLTSFFMLKVHIKAVTIRMDHEAVTRFVSSVLGYIQTPCWHPFARPPAAYSTNDTRIVVVPSDHWTLISVVHSFYHCWKPTIKYASLVTHKRNSVRPHKHWELNFTNHQRPHEVLLNDLITFSVEFYNVRTHSFRGGRMLFSFHQPTLAPQRDQKSAWNCSVPYWPNFRQHFVCNGKEDCARHEDEMWCPDNSCEQGGLLLSETCYTFLRLPEGTHWWHQAHITCKRRGATLASFPYVKDYYTLILLSQTKGYFTRFYLGLYSPEARYPYMYRYVLRWYNGSISHYTNCDYQEYPPVCGYQEADVTIAVYCSSYTPSESYAICQTTSSSVINLSQKRTGTGKLRHRSTKGTQSNILKTLPRITCPDLHWTHMFLACDAFSACCHDHNTRSSHISVASVSVHVATAIKTFMCQHGMRSVPYSLVCNHLQDCADNSDENFCVFPICLASSQYKCANGQCIQSLHYCDGTVQCMDESDETDCQFHYGIRQVCKRHLRRPPLIVDFDGRGCMKYSPLTRWREMNAGICPDTHVFCPHDGYCLPVYVRCNGLYDCPGREDELDCDSYTCSGLYRCRGLLNICLHPNHVCDGWPQCPQHDDELFCNLTCPVSCTCLGHAFFCTNDFSVELFSRLRYLDASGTALQPGRLVDNPMLVYLSLAKCDLAHLDNLSLPNVLSLDLSDNKFKVFTVAELNLMKNLKNLSLARNPLSSIFSGNHSTDFLVHENIFHIDLTYTKLGVLDMACKLHFPSLFSLNLSNSDVTVLRDGDFQSLTSLRILDVRGCPISVFPRHVFGSLKNLQLVFADDYRLCCEANLPRGFNVENCKAPLNEMSSCDALLRSDVYRVCLSVLAALALCGNLSCLFLRIISLTGRGKTGFNVFVTHLCVSDFVMGVFLATVGIADRLYLGTYLWEEDRWRNSISCQVAGILGLLSSEVSALIICLITLDRFLVIRFPFSRLRFSTFSAQVASFITWTVGFVLVIVPILPITGYRHFYGQTGICVPLPITRNKFVGHHYAFGVMILLNLVVFFVIATGQVSVYMSMTNNAMSSIDTTRKSRDLIVARRLIAVVVTDFLCWFPLGLLGVLATQGVPVSGELNVAMAIFVMPLNSALNPFLYTLNIIQEKRQRATEMKLIKVIIDRGVDNN